jgi:hypothetical protein
MELSAHGFWAIVHGMGFGALYLLACSGAVVELWRRTSPLHGEFDHGNQTADDTFLRAYLIGMAVLAWITVLTGAYMIYPWYRAALPANVTDLSGYPQRLLMSSPATAQWHAIGMEWKEHVAWLAPISITMAAAVFFTYGERGVRAHPPLRKALMGFVLVSFFSAGIAGLFGAMLSKKAPVEGGATLHLVSDK